MLLIDKIRKKIGDPPERQNRYTPKQHTAFQSAVEDEAKLIHEKAQSWAYIASPAYSGNSYMGGLRWQVLSPECKQFNNQRQQIFIFEPCLEEIAVNLAADLSTAAELRRYRDEQEPDDLVQLKAPGELTQVDAPDDEFLLSPIDPDTPKPSLIPPK